MSSNGRLARTARWQNHNLREEDGQVLVITGLAMFLMVALAAFALSVGTIYLARHRAQVAADAGALAAVHQLQTSANAVTTAATTYVGYNSPGYSSANVTMPNGLNGNQVNVTVSQPVSLPFGGLFGLTSDTVSATAGAQISASQATVPEGEISPTGCSNGAYGFCEYFAPSSVGTGNNSDWTVYSGSVDVQPCGGAVGASCTDPYGNPIQNEVIDLNGSNAGSIYQSVTTIPGDEYDLTFDLSGNPAGENCSYVTFTGNVEIAPSAATGGVTQQNFSHTNSCTQAGSTVTEIATYQVVSVPFTATAGSTAIYFASTTQTGYEYGYADYGPEITNISLNYGTAELIK